jgi:uncharacterized protein with HEPN domain
MTERDARLALEHMLDFAERLLRVTRGRTQADVERDEALLGLVELLLVKLGEASRRVPEEVRRAHPEIPWPMIAGMRNRIIHVYDDIDYEIVWDTIQTDLPPLVDYLRRILR